MNILEVKQWKSTEYCHSYKKLKNDLQFLTAIMIKIKVLHKSTSSTLNCLGLLLLNYWLLWSLHKNNCHNR